MRVCTSGDRTYRRGSQIAVVDADQGRSPRVPDPARHVVDIPSYQCKAGDVVAIRERKASKTLAEGNLAWPTSRPTWSSTKPR